MENYSKYSDFSMGIRGYKRAPAGHKRVTVKDGNDCFVYFLPKNTSLKKFKYWLLYCTNFTITHDKILLGSNSKYTSQIVG